MGDRNGTRARESTLGTIVNCLARTVGAAGLLIATGCAISAEDRIVGIYSLDALRSSLPDIPGSPGIQSRLNQVKRNTRLKVRSDHTFVLTGIRITEGTWRLEGDTIHLKPKDPNAPSLLVSDDGEMTGRLEQKAIIVEPETPFGKISIYLRKTG